MIDPIDYLVLRFDGEYALLQRIDQPQLEPLFIARALLPEGTDEGSRLHYEMLEYTLL